VKADAQLRHGFTLGHLDTLARQAVMGNRSWWSGGDRVEQTDLARYAIVEHLYAADEAPDPLDLLRAAQRALGRHKETEMRTHGIPVSSRETGAHFAVYWDAPPTGSPENAVVEVLALRQIFPTLPGSHQRALLALAATGDYRAAAEALGVGENTFQTWITRGRAAFRVLWHEGEAPSRQWGRDRRAGRGAGTPLAEDRTTTGMARMRRRHQRAEKASTAAGRALLDSLTDGSE
jgi:hypothetical protein